MTFFIFLFFLLNQFVFPSFEFGRKILYIYLLIIYKEYRYQNPSNMERIIIYQQTVFIAFYIVKRKLSHSIFDIKVLHFKKNKKKNKKTCY